MSADRPLGNVGSIERAFARLAPENVVFEAADIGPHVIHPREAALSAGAVETRQREFATGRWCAARALARVGAPSGPILRGAFREPLWPPGFTGSIAHHGRVGVAAACTLGDRGTAIGIDLADCSDLAPYRHVLHLIGCERDDLGFVGMKAPIAAAYLFSVKEAAVKCLSPFLNAFLDMSKLRVRPASAGCHIAYVGTDRLVHARAAQIGSFIIAFASMDGS